MEVLIIDKIEVQKELTMDICIKLMEKAFLLIAKGEAGQPLRHALWLPDKAGLLGMMPSYSSSFSKMAIKVVSVFPENHTKGLPSHMGVVLLFDSTTGKLLAILDGEEITAIRTAAASGLATNYMSNKNSNKLAIIGAGVQGFVHVEAISQVREISEVTIWSRNPDHAKDLKSRLKSKYNFTFTVEKEISAATIEADIICTTTSSKNPLIDFKDIKPGVHINAVGACTPNARELGSELVINSSIITDNLESLLNEAGDYLIPLKKGEIKTGHVKGVLSDVVSGIIKGRESDDEITIYESLGIGVEDLVVANYLYNNALSNNTTQRVNI